MHHESIAAGGEAAPPWGEGSEVAGTGDDNRPRSPHNTTPTPFPVPPRVAAPAATPPIVIGTHVFDPTPGISDPRAALKFAARLMAESPGADIFVRVAGAWQERRYPYLFREATGSGDIVVGYFNRPDELACELRRLMGESSVYICPNPGRRVDRDIPRNRLVRLAEGQDQGLKKDEVETIRYAIIDVDPVNRRPDENARSYQHAAAMSLMREILAGEPAIARSAYRGGSGNGAHLLIRLPDLENDPGNQAAVRAFIRALAKKYSRTTIAIPEDQMGEGIDRFTGAKIDTSTYASKTIGLPGSLKCKGPDSSDRPRRVVELADLDRDLSPFDVFGWLAVNAPDWDPTEIRDEADPGADPASSPAELSGSARKRKARSARTWLARQPPAIEGHGGDEYTFSVVCGVIRICWGFTVDEIIAILARWNATCLPPWGTDKLGRKIAAAMKVVEPPREENPFEEFDGVGFWQ